MAADIKVYQGNQIGGCVTVISTEVNGEIHRIMVDYGASLPGCDIKKDFDYPWIEKPVDAVFFTHYHGDHVGRVNEIPKEIPIYMGSTARQIMINIQEALCGHDEDGVSHEELLAILKDNTRIHEFEKDEEHYKSISIPGFTIEPYSVDHSAYDAYMFLIEAVDETKESGRKVILHTGDFRGHGRRGKAILPMIHSYIHQFGKRKVDSLIIEGTMMSRLNEKVKTETEMMIEASDYLKEHKYAFLICSSTNLDSLASFYQAAQMAARPYSRYMYTYNEYYRIQMKTFDKTAGEYSGVYKFDNVYRLNLQQKLQSPKWKEAKSQKELMEITGFVAVIKPEMYCEKYIDAFVDDYEAGIIKEKPVIIYSMWDGYIDDRKDNKAKNVNWINFLKKQEARGIEIKHLHTSGHASASMIRAVIKAVDPQEEIIPMHTERPEEFKKLHIDSSLKDKIIDIT